MNEIKFVLLLSILYLFSCNRVSENNSTNNVTIPNAISQLKVDTSNPKLFEFTEEFESFNKWLKIGVSEKRILEKLGKPLNQKLYYSEVTGSNCKEFNYINEGVVLILEENDDKFFQVIDINILGNSNFKLNSGVKIGDSIKIVKEKYSNQINLKESHKEVIIIGDVYYGLYFFIHKDKIQQIQIGSLAE
jgi:hypothetical protein